MSCPGFYHIATIHLLPPTPPSLPPLLFPLSRRLLFSFPLVSHCCFQIATLVSRNRPFYITDPEHYTPRHFTMVQRPSDTRPPLFLSPPLPRTKSKLSSNWNFVAVR